MGSDSPPPPPYPTRQLPDTLAAVRVSGLDLSDCMEELTELRCEALLLKGPLARSLAHCAHIDSFSFFAPRGCAPCAHV